VARAQTALSIFETTRRNKDVRASSNRRQSGQRETLDWPRYRRRKANRQLEFFKVRALVQDPHRPPRRGERARKTRRRLHGSPRPCRLPERDLVRNIAENHFWLQRAHAVEQSLFTLMLEQPDNVHPASAAAVTTAPPSAGL